MEKIYCLQNICQKRSGHFITLETHISQLEKIHLWTEFFYSNIRKTNIDTILISKNSNIPEDIIEKIKQHVFLDNHAFGYGTQRFTIDEDVAAAWHRLYQNTFIKSDLVWLQQVYAESLVMDGVKIEYKYAHEVVTKCTIGSNPCPHVQKRNKNGYIYKNNKDFREGKYWFLLYFYKTWWRN